ncbi:MAG: DUF421 domain-containing protein [Clostridia bacterium]
MGKRQLGQMQPFEFVLALIIADLATIPMAEISVPILHGIVPLLSLVVLHFFLTILCKKSVIFNNLVSGKPVIVINPNGIDYNSLKALNISVDDLFEAIRSCNFFGLEQIEYAIMETNGKLNVMPKAEFTPVTNGDLKIKVQQESLPVTIVSEGVFMAENAGLANISKEFVTNLLNKNKIKKLKDVLVLTIDVSGKVFLQKKFDKFKSFNVKLTESK